MTEIEIDDVGTQFNYFLEIEQARIKAILVQRNYSYEQLIDFAANYVVAFNEKVQSVERLNELDAQKDELIKLNYVSDKSKDKIIRVMGELQHLQAQKSLIEGVIDGIGYGIKMQKKSHSQKGGEAKKSKYDPLKELAAKLVNAKNFKSRRNAAQTITSEIVAESEKLGIALSKNQAEITITGWLKEMGLPANI